MAIEVAQAKKLAETEAKEEQADAMDEAGLWQSEEFCRQLLGDLEAIFGKDHKATLGTMNNLANVLRAQGKWQEAEELHRETLKGMKSRLGEDHPHTLKSMNNLAVVQEEFGRKDTFMTHNLQDEDSQRYAEDAMRSRLQAAEGLEAKLGASHPDALGARYGLAELLAERGRLGEAAAELRKALPGYKAQYGDDHPMTRSVARQLERLEAESNTDEFQRNLDVVRFEEDGGFILPASAVCNLAFDLREAGQMELAKQLYERTKGMDEEAEIGMKPAGVIKLAFHCEGVGLLEWKEWLLQEVGDATENMVARVADVASASTSAGASASSRFDPELEQGDPGHESVMGEASRLAELGFAAT